MKKDIDKRKMQRGVAEILRSERATLRRLKKKEKAASSCRASETTHVFVDEESSINEPFSPSIRDIIPKLYSTCVQQVEQIEEKMTQLGKAEGDLAELDKAVKMLSGITRTLEQLSNLHKAQKTEEGESEHEFANPSDLREQLAVRLGGLCSSRND